MHRTLIMDARDSTLGGSRGTYVPADTTAPADTTPTNDEHYPQTGDRLPGSTTLDAMVEISIGDGEFFEVYFSIDNNPDAHLSNDVAMAFSKVEATSPRVIGALNLGKVFLSQTSMNLVEFTAHLCEIEPRRMFTRYILPGRKAEDESFGPMYYFAWHATNGNCEALRSDRSDVVVRFHGSQFGGRIISDLIYMVCDAAIAMYDQNKNDPANNPDDSPKEQ